MCSQGPTAPARIQAAPISPFTHVAYFPQANPPTQSSILFRSANLRNLSSCTRSQLCRARRELDAERKEATQPAVPTVQGCAGGRAGRLG